MRATVTIVLTAALAAAGLTGGCQRRELAQRSWTLDAAPDQVAMFAPGVVSTGQFEMNAAFTPDGSEVYFTRASADWNSMTIYRSEWDGREWSAPRVASFSGTFVDTDPHVDASGQRLFFASKRTPQGHVQGDFDIWVVERAVDGWGEPEPVTAVNSSEHDVHPCLTLDGTLWFSSNRRDGLGQYDVWYAEGDGVAFLEPVNPGPPVNSAGEEVDVALSPDGSMLVFAGHDHPDHLGSGDLYVSTWLGDGWSEPENIWEPVNSTAMECCPSFTPDGSFLYFMSTRQPEEAERVEVRVSEDDSVSVSTGEGPGNGLGDLYATPVETVEKRRAD